MGHDNQYKDSTDEELDEQEEKIRNLQTEQARKMAEIERQRNFEKSKQERKPEEQLPLFPRR